MIEVFTLRNKKTPNRKNRKGVSKKIKNKS